MSDRLTPERVAEIAESDLGDWYAGEWRTEYVESTPDRYAHYVVKHQESGHILAELPDFAGTIALFIADAHEAIPELLAELAAVRTELVRTRKGIAADFEAALLKTTDGDDVHDDFAIPAGEVRRIIAELIDGGESPASQHYDKVPDPLDGCHWCACGNRWPCKDAGEAAA